MPELCYHQTIPKNTERGANTTTKRTLSRILALALALVLTLTLAPAAFAADTETPNPSGSCGENATWEYVAAQKTLVIRGEGAMADYSAEDPAPWHSFAAEIEAITVYESVTVVGSYAFAGCTALKRVGLDYTVELINAYAFDGCTALATVIFNGTEDEMPPVEEAGNDVLFEEIWYPVGLPFSDMEHGFWAYDYVQILWNYGIVNGYPQGDFRPNDSITRAEFVKLLSNIADSMGETITEDETASGKFSDVKSGEWFVPSVEWAAEAGLINGYEDGSFRPDAQITREEMATIIARFVESYEITLEEVNAPADFTDAGSIQSYAKDAVAAMQVAGLITGYEDGSFLPQGLATRAEASTMLCRLFLCIFGLDA